jgi:hypothetical protein
LILAFVSVFYADKFAPTPPMAGKIDCHKRAHSRAPLQNLRLSAFICGFDVFFLCVLCAFALKKEILPLPAAGSE